MKKFFAAAILAFGFSVVSFAQDKGNVELGLNIGFNSSTVSTEDENADAGNGVNFAGAIDYYFSKRWSIKGKLIYDQKGWDNGFIKENNTGFSYRTDYNLNYLTIPVMANWHFGRTKNWYLNFGPYVGFLTSATETKFGTDVKDALNTTDFGIAFGIGVKIPLADRFKFSIEYENESGLSDVFKNSEENITNSRSALNFGFVFQVK